MRQVLISFDLRADFGVFKKPDVNVGLQPTFNMLHKPALLGILGAIAGLEGYQRRGEFPVYFRELRDLKVGIEPIDHENGNFTKTVIKYTNTVGYANDDGTLIITEQTLRKPAYRCYLLADLDHPLQTLLYERIMAGEAEYLPYLGKNECSAWWETSSEYEYSADKPDISYSVTTLFQQLDWSVKEEKDDGFESFDLFGPPKPDTFIYFERLPVDFDDRLFQYHLGNFSFTNFLLKPTARLENLFYLPSENKYVQLF